MPRELFEKPPCLPTKLLSLSLTHTYKIELKLWIFYECQNINPHQHTRRFSWTVTLLMEESISPPTPKKNLRYEIKQSWCFILHSWLIYIRLHQNVLCRWAGHIAWEAKKCKQPTKIIVENLVREARCWHEYNINMNVTELSSKHVKRKNVVRSRVKCRDFVTIVTQSGVILNQRTHYEILEKVLHPFANLPHENSGTTPQFTSHLTIKDN